LFKIYLVFVAMATRVGRE